jgi:hypothetical protein
MTQSSLYDKILKASEEISRTAKSSGNYIVVNQSVMNIYENYVLDKNRRVKIEKIYVKI